MKNSPFRDLLLILYSKAGESASGEYRVFRTSFASDLVEPHYPVKREGVVEKNRQGNSGVPLRVMDSLTLALMGRQFCPDGLISTVESKPL